VLSRSVCQSLKRQDDIFFHIVRDQFGVQNEVFDVLLFVGNIPNDLQHIRVRLRHVLKVPGVNVTVFALVSFLPIEVNLPSKSVILILACKFNSFEALEYDVHSFGGLSEHGFHWGPDFDVAGFLQQLVLVSTLHQL